MDALAAVGQLRPSLIAANRIPNGPNKAPKINQRPAFLPRLFAIIAAATLHSIHKTLNISLLSSALLGDRSWDPRWLH
jgi:hypothetical protein